VAPLVIQAFAVVAFHEWWPTAPDVAGLVSLGFSTTVGFAFLAYEFGIYSLIIAIPYFPVMAMVLVGFSLGVVGWVYHDYP